MFQGVYRDNERDGPGILNYADGRCDVGLWKRNRLVRICSAVDSPSALSELQVDAPSSPEESGPPAWKPDRVPRSRTDALRRCRVAVVKAPFEYQAVIFHFLNKHFI